MYICLYFLLFRNLYLSKRIKTDDIFSNIEVKMNKSLIIIFVLGLIAIYGCTSPDDKAFKEGVKRINEINSNFGTSMKTIPNAVKGIDE